MLEEELQSVTCSEVHGAVEAYSSIDCRDCLLRVVLAILMDERVGNAATRSCTKDSLEHVVASLRMELNCSGRELHTIRDVGAA